MQFLENLNQLVSAPLFKAGNEAISLFWILKLILGLLGVFVVTNLLKRLLSDRILIRFKLSQGNREAISTLISYSAGALGFLIVLSVNGLDVASLSVVIGGLGVGIGFGLQDLTKNLVSGLTLLLEGKLQVGDYIEFNGVSGYIKEIAIRSTIIRTFDGGDIVVPNSNLVGNQVLNWSYKNFTGKIRLEVGVAYDSDPIIVAETLLNSAYMEPSVLYEPPPKVIFKGFGDSSLNFELWVWLSRIDEGISVRSALNYIIEHNFRQIGIKIPFPQRSLWLHNLDLPSSKTDSEIHNGLKTNVSTTAKIPQFVSIRHLLKEVPYFQQTPDLYLRRVIEAGYRKMLSASEILFHEGDMAASVYIVLLGTIEVFSVSLDKRIKVYSTGEFFGETPIMLGVPYLATARAIGETSVFVISKSNFEKLLQTCPKLAEILAQELSKEQEEYSGLRQQLQDLGILNMNEQHHNFIAWVQTRLKQLFNAS
ncbi:MULTISPECIES: mechanosensitive ion channel domain-containing protein [Nostocales]|uniref:Mechanosensitive ion channel n=3 Tax=Nostocales TaxID=1161 RepID=A0A0C1NKK2_9CYAN|nr:mechanosensitive ion channel domain-containing protein [Tolypothrix bouteillei]KAF3887619.1 mechanosensitive ion channel [Tolypothrix bouteillei VB521301]